MHHAGYRHRAFFFQISPLVQPACVFIFRHSRWMKLKFGIEDRLHSPVAPEAELASS